MIRLINEEDAYNVLTDYYHHRTEIQHQSLKEALSRVPTIEPGRDIKHAESISLISAEPKKGKWIYKTQNVQGGKGQTYGKWQCSCCKKKEPRRRDYCPNCGARMSDECAD